MPWDIPCHGIRVMTRITRTVTAMTICRDACKEDYGKGRLYDRAMTPPAIEEVSTDEIVKCTFTVIVAAANYARHQCWGLTATAHALLRSAELQKSSKQGPHAFVIVTNHFA